MKFFSTLVNIVPVVLLGAVSVMAQSSTVVVTTIKSFTTVSSSLTTTVNDITFSNIIDDGAEIASGLANITKAISKFSFVSGTPPYPNEAAEQVVEVLTDFVKVHQALLGAIIGKHSLASQFFLTAPIAAALRALENVVDTFAFDLISLIPTQKDAATTQITSLNVTFTEAITTYGN